jgi:hypothetical protein
LEALSKQSAEQHSAAMAQGAAFHTESLEQLDGLHAKLDELNGCGGAFLTALATGELPPRPDGQSVAERVRVLRALKRCADNELPDLVHAERLRKLGEQRDVATARQQAAAEATVLAEAVTNEGLDSMDTVEAARVLREYEERMRAMIRDERKKLKDRIKTETRAKAAAKAKGKSRVKRDVRGGASSGASPGASAAAAASSAAAAASSAAAGASSCAAAAFSDTSEDESSPSALTQCVAPPAGASGTAAGAVAAASAGAVDVASSGAVDAASAGAPRFPRRSLFEILKQNEEADAARHRHLEEVESNRPRE